jgi:hypothetical protein
MTRKTFGGYGLTELRTIARDLKIPGRTRMTGDELLTACLARWDANRREKENAVLRTLTLIPGARFTLTCGCVLEATTHVLSWGPYGALYVHGAYVSICPKHQRGTGHTENSTEERDLEYINRENLGLSGYPAFKHMVYAIRPASRVGDTGTDGTPIVKICDDGYVITQGMVDAEVARIDAATLAPALPAMHIIGVNASTNMFV